MSEVKEDKIDLTSNEEVKETLPDGAVTLELKEEPKVTPPVVEVEPEDEKSPTQYRVERAERQTEERILKQLGVESLEQITDKLNETKSLQDEIDKLKNEKSRQTKSSKLKARLVQEDVFDEDALLYMVDLDEVEDTDEGLDNVIEVLKQKKPNFFGVRQITGDDHKSSKKHTPSNPIRELEQSGDYQGALAAFLRSNK